MISLPSTPLFFFIPIAVILLALLVLLWSARFKRRMGLPPGQIVYADAENWKKPHKPLYDSSLGLTGKPDYLIRTEDVTIPVEVKSTWAPYSPYDSHIMQLAAYCFLVEHTTGIRPPYGLLRYHNRTFKIRYGEQLETDLIEIIHTIRLEKNSSGSNRSHDQVRRCDRCGFRNICDQRI